MLHTSVPLLVALPLDGVPVTAHPRGETLALGEMESPAKAP